MSEGDVSTIRDEDVLRRMWQQTEDFTRKKEIRAHMYRLREERLRDLYSPEPTLEGKGNETGQMHVKSFADQSFQSMKTKEVRDAGSPPKEFTYRGQDLKEMSNAGWNVESENKTTDDGHTNIKTVQANIEGRYDVEGGKGRFAAIDHHKQAVTEYHDENSSLKRNESSSNSAAHEQVVRQTDDGTHFSSTTSSSTSSKFQQVSSSTKAETVPYITDESDDISHHKDFNTDVKDTSQHYTKNTDYEQSLRQTDFEHGELISRKVEYPDDSTKIVVETRCLPDGTKVTSTRKEFRQPIIQTNHSEQRSQKIRTENKSYSTQQHSNVQKSFKSTQETNIVDSQKAQDSYDFNSNRQIDNSDYELRNTNQKHKDVIHKDKYTDYKTNNTFRSENMSNVDEIQSQRKIIKETEIKNKEHILNESQQQKSNRSIDVNDQEYQTTYKTDYSQKKISNDWSSTQQAWASSLRSDTPTTARSPTRASSPGSKTIGSSTSSLRSSVSPEKYSRKPPSRGSSPNKTNRSSPSRIIKDDRSNSHSTIIITEKSSTKGLSPERPPIHPSRVNSSPNRRNNPRSSVSPDKYSRNLDVSNNDSTNVTRVKKEEKNIFDKKVTHETEYDRHFRSNLSPEKNLKNQRNSKSPSPLRQSPERKPSYMRPTSTSKQSTQTIRTSPSRSPSKSPDRKIYSALEDDHYRFIDEETKMYTRVDKDDNENETVVEKNKNVTTTQKSKVNEKISPERTHRRSSEKQPRSPTPTKGTFTKERISVDSHDITDRIENIDYVNATNVCDDVSKRSQSPTKYDTYRKNQKFDDYTSKGREKSTSPSKSTHKTTPRNSASPTKSLPTNKTKIVTDFIAHEKYSTKSSNKDHPRQLVTPSTSPTRKPKQETVPSITSGQSSPTTSVSGFVYFSSQSPTGPVVTDLDDREINFGEKGLPTKPDSLNLTRAPSPSKIPCRSPSPEKQIMPRKSSLKKPSTDTNVTSPIEKPPTSFQISPTVESIDHKVVKKDHVDKYTDDSAVFKIKPPFERRETYEDRCRKILGMMDDANSEKHTPKPKHNNNKPTDNSRSGSISPCRSPSSKQEMFIKNVTDSFENNSTEDFIKHERNVTEELMKTTDTSRSKSNSRDASPTKLQDIIHVKPTIPIKIKKELEEVTDRNSFKATNTNTRVNSRTPSPSKTVSSPLKTCRNVSEINNKISSDKEAKILEKVQKTLRKLSPDRKDRSFSRENSPDKITTSLKDLDIQVTDNTKVFSIETASNENLAETENVDLIKNSKSGTNSRNKSPTKIPSSKIDKNSSTSKPRSVSPKKPISAIEIPKSAPSTSPVKSTIMPTTNKKPTSPNKSDRSFSIDKKSADKQTVVSKNISVKHTTIKSNVPSKTLNKENVSPKKDNDVKVTRTASDISLKTKKISPQRIKSKPEIQVRDATATKTSKPSYLSVKSQKATYKQSQNQLPAKPKSATALNNSSEDDDIIVDVQLAKSSRENSPDRICPTPVNIMDDVSTPRLPDEVNEPDDDFRKRTHHIIHETESIVDDIVEISEEDELFTKHSNVSESDECLLSVNDKVSKFLNKIEMVKKPKSTVDNFTETEKKIHSDFQDKTLKTDDCLLSVSEKVTKFAKGPDDGKRNIDQHKIENEYDNNTTYQDDYTKLSVNDKAHFFVESAQNTKNVKTKPAHKVDRPDFSDVDEDLKSDECLLSVSDKVTKFVKTAEQFLNDNYEVDQKEKRIKEQHDEIMKKIVESVDYESKETQNSVQNETHKNNVVDHKEEKLGSFAKETVSSHAKGVDSTSSNLKHDKTPTAKITTLRSSEAVKKAKALFENIASATPISKDSKSTKLTDIGVLKKSPKTESTIVHHPSIEDNTVVDVPDSSNQPKSTRPTISSQTANNYKTDKSLSPTRLSTQSPVMSRSKSPAPQQYDNKRKPILSKQPAEERDESPRRKEEHKKALPTTEVPGYQRPTKTNQGKDETKITEEIEVSTRRGSGKFGVELRRTSMDKSTSVTTERRRSSVEHHQPCIEDIFDLDLLEQMLEKVVAYEQRRRIRAQIRVVRKKTETEIHSTTNSNITKTKQTSVSTPKTRSPERPKIIQKVTTTERRSSHSKTVSPDRHKTKEQPKPPVNGTVNDVMPKKHTRLTSPEKSSRTSTRQSSPEKKTRTVSPSKTPTSKSKPSRFNEYASAYMKKVGLPDGEQTKNTERKTKEVVESDDHSITKIEENVTEIKHSSTVSKSYTERSVSRDKIEVINETTHVNGKRSPSPQKTRSPDRKPQSPIDRLYQRSPSPDFKRAKPDTAKETIIKTVYEVEKKPQISKQPTQEEKPSWVTNRNLKKVTSENRTYSNKKMEVDKPKYRATSPSKVISKPIDVITSSYGPGPLDADGRPLFGIKALRNGASNYQVKGTVIRQEFHSRNGGEPEGTVSVTAYSTEPEELERLLQVQGDRPSRLHGLAAITTTKKFGGTTGTTLKEAHSKEERASLEQFTHSDRRVESQIQDMSQSMSESVKEERPDTQKKIERSSDRTQKKLEERSERQKSSDKSERTQKIEDRSERLQRLEDRSERSQRKVEEKKTVRQSSVKSLTEKYIKSASDTNKSDRVTYPKAGLILRTANMRDSISSESSAHAGLARTDSEQSLGSIEDTVTRSEHTVTESDRHDGGYHSTSKTEHRVHKTYSTGKEQRSENTQTIKTDRQNNKTEFKDRVPKDSSSSQKFINQERSGQTTRTEQRQEKSFLDSSSKVTGVQDILTRMKNADIVIEDGDTTEDAEARALLNKFLGATVLMAGMQNYVQEKPSGKITVSHQETVRSSKPASQSPRNSGASAQPRDLQNVDLEQYWDERELKKLLDSCTDYEQRRRIRARIRALMAEQEACAAAVTAALEAADGDAREEEEVTTVTSSVRRNSTEKTVSSSTTTRTSKVIESMTKPAPKPVSPFAKFRQLEKQNSLNSPNSPKSPQSPGSPSQPYFKFTDPALQQSAATIKERLLQWCRDKTRDYENVKLENFSTSWADGMAFCALVHRFLPNTFDYSKLSPQNRRHNFTLAFKVADEKAGIYPLLDVDDMVAMRKPDWKCVFTYVQAIHRRFKDED